MPIIRRSDRSVAATAAAASKGDSMDSCYRFSVKGRVQGVHFRQSTRQRALQLGLRGWVRNRADGSVEGLACGAGTDLDLLREWLQQGPEQARVDQVRWQACPVPDLTGFDVLR
jgi:acylphosphatase